MQNLYPPLALIQDECQQSGTRRGGSVHRPGRAMRFPRQPRHGGRCFGVHAPRHAQCPFRKASPRRGPDRRDGAFVPARQIHAIRGRASVPSVLRAATTEQLDATWRAWTAVPTHLMQGYARTIAESLGWAWGTPDMPPSNIATDFRLRDRAVTVSVRDVDVTEISCTVAEVDDPRLDREPLVRWFDAEVARHAADCGEPVVGTDGERTSAHWLLGPGLGAAALIRTDRRVALGFRTGLALADPDAASELLVADRKSVV